MAPGKRKQGSNAQKSSSKKSKGRNGQKAEVKDVHVPIDEGFHEDGMW